MALSKYDSGQGYASIVEAYVYDVFGAPIIVTSAGTDGNWFTAGDGTTASASVYGNPYMFTGRRYDDETGLYYYRARMYAPDLGRFLQPDPIGYDDGMNMYAYVGNNPASFVDPFGLKIEFLPDVSWRDKIAYRRAIKKLSKSALFRNTYGYLARADTATVYIGIGTKGGNYHTPSPAYSIVGWNRTSRLETYRGEMSPALSLAHEMEHARIRMIGGIDAPRDEKWAHKPKEEDYIVKWFEGPIARELGEPYREDYEEPYWISLGIKKGCGGKK